MRLGAGWILSAALLAGSAGPLVPIANAQYGRHDRFNQGYRGQHPYTDQYDRNYNRNYDRRHQGGIGPGKGALIGGAGGAALGALFGGGLKGALIGGGIGAGGGAVLGKVHQDHQNRDYRDEYYRR